MFKRVVGSIGPDPVHDQNVVWRKARRSLLRTCQLAWRAAEAILISLAEEVQVELGDERDVRHDSERSQR